MQEVIEKNHFYRDEGVVIKNRPFVHMDVGYIKYYKLLLPIYNNKNTALYIYIYVYIYILEG